ncbi:MAG: diguanylate cyclase, partial [Casimicrobiaceae bacterium]
MAASSRPHSANPNRASAAQPAGAGRAREVAFVRRVHCLRVLGMALGALCVAAVRWLQGSEWPWWILVACNALVCCVNWELASRVAHQNRRLDEVGRTDELTGLANRRHGLAVAEAELVRARETGRAVSLILLDIDHFKHINDVHGHHVGDDVLRAVAVALRASRSGSDTPVRYGDDEFILILPETDLDGALETATR